MIHKLNLQRIKNFRELKCVFSKGPNYNISWRNPRLCGCWIKASKKAFCFSSTITKQLLQEITLTFFPLMKLGWKKVPQQLVSFLGLGTSSKAPWTQSSSAGELGVMISPMMWGSCKNQPWCQYLQSNCKCSHLCCQITTLFHLYQVLLGMRIMYYIHF